MGTVTHLADHRRRSAPAPVPRRTVFCFDLADVGTYLAAERVDRLLGAEADWVPARDPLLRSALPPAAVAARAAALHLPLIWPERHPAPVPRAMRAAARAGELGEGAAFVLAATRLAFCGGYDLEDPEVLAEAAAAAGMSLPECLAAATDRRRDVAIDAAGRWLVAHGARSLPVVRAGRTLLPAEGRIAEAAAAVRRQAPASSTSNVSTWTTRPRVSRAPSGARTP